MDSQPVAVGVFRGGDEEEGSWLGRFRDAEDDAVLREGGGVIVDVDQVNDDLEDLEELARFDLKMSF